MKAFGRLLLATALIVPAGLVTAQSAGATPKPTATCTTNTTEALKLSPGVRLTRPVGQTITSTGGTVSGCTGVGIAGDTGGTFSFKVNRSAVTCNTIRGKEFVGSGKLTWDEAGSNSGIITDIKIRLTFTTYKSISLKGVVTGSYTIGSNGAKIKNGYLLNEPFSSKLTTTSAVLKPVGVGEGTCQNKARVKSVGPWENDGDTKL
jgi:hypothetical protein